MFKKMRFLMVIGGLTASLGAMATGPVFGDHAVLSCSQTLTTTYLSTTYESAINPAAGCMPTFKALQNEGMMLIDTSTTSQFIAYTFTFSN